mmetsp:Transcript_11867/g.43392  ORF Transcript_11867/g.43392 Transcript_11867/m.43392 type:complete len:662 (+) Transcript_11867:559-2544(+)|eukprot:scaffold7393_cov497-Prasinococcus_capsulatus_cf.AAC.5
MATANVLQRPGVSPIPEAAQTRVNGPASEIGVFVLPREQKASGNATSLAPAGGRIHVASDTIECMRVKINTEHGITTTRNKLIYGGKELRDRLENLAVGEEVGEQDDLHIVMRLQDIREVWLRTTDGKEHVLSLEETKALSHVRDLKHKIKQAQLTPLDECDELMLGNKRLEDDMPLAELNSLVDEGDRIIVCCVKRTAKVRVKSLNENGKTFVQEIVAEETVRSLKDKIASNSRVSADNQQLFVNGKELKEDSKPLKEYGIDSNSTIVLLGAQLYQGFEPSKPSSVMAARLTASARAVSVPESALSGYLKEAREGLDAGLSPTLAPSGSGGTYFIPDSQGRNVAVFKPADEEPYAMNNPRGFASAGSQPSSPDVLNGVWDSGLRAGIRPGEAAVREAAAYLLDHEGFAGVPKTTLVGARSDAFHNGDGGSPTGPNAGVTVNELSRPNSWPPLKVGSLQQYILDTVGDCEEYGPSAWPVQEVHKICQLDLRILNTDRTGANILVRQVGDSEFKLTPIDHGYCLPECRLEDVSFEWLYWPQAREDFNEETIEYIMSIDPDKDAAALTEGGVHLPPCVLRYSRIATRLLQMCIQMGIQSPHEIGRMMCRPDGEESSDLEVMIAKADSVMRNEKGIMACDFDEHVDTYMEVVENVIANHLQYVY